MRIVALNMDVECEVDDLCGRLKEEDALWLAVMRMLDRIARGDVAIGGDLKIEERSPLVEAVRSAVVGALVIRPLA